MGLIDRLRRISTAKVEAFLSKVEDPEVLLPQLIKEMEGQVRTITEAEAKSMAAVKGAERDVEQVKEKLARLQRGAETAMSQGDEVTARDAVSAQIDLEADLGRKEETLERARGAATNARDARLDLQNELDELRSKKDEILTRARVARTQKQVEKTVRGPVDSSGSILDAVSRLESKVEETEAELAVQREVGRGSVAPSLERRLDDLERGSEVENRMAALKRHGGESGGE
jgi:phage shock protein A